MKFGAVQALSGDLLVSRGVLWVAFGGPGGHSGELFGPPGTLLGWISTLWKAFGSIVG